MLPFEILVHVSAPSRGRDDARYRTEAQAFLDFEPVESHFLCRARESERDDAERRALSLGELHSPPLPRDNERDKRTTCGPGIYGRGETNSVEKSLHVIKDRSQKEPYANNSTEANQNAENWLLRFGDVFGSRKHGGSGIEKTHTPHEPSSRVRDDAGTRLSRVQDVFRKELSIYRTPLRQSAAEFGTVRKDTHRLSKVSQESSSEIASTIRPYDTSAPQLTSVKETPRLLIVRTPALPRRRTAPTTATPSQRAQPLRRTQSDSWQTPPSTIPDSQPNVPLYSLSEITSSPCLKRPLQSSSPSPTRPSPSGAKRPRLQLSSSPRTANLAPKSSLLSAPPTSSPPAAPPSSLPAPPTHNSSSSPYSTSNTSPLEIHPPRPETSTARFTTHLTTSLTNHTALLTSSYPRYQKTQTRHLHPLERGHWLVHFSGQDPIFQKDLWEFMRSYIGDGRAGWGVWAVRENVGTQCGGEKDRNTDVGAHTATKKEEVLKVYCWGEVVAEVWLIMYMGGKRKIKGLGSKWIDAGGEAVVRME